MIDIRLSLLKKFAKTDGLLKGTALISNLVTLASISILPGFGASGLFIANTIQMTVSGLLEIPTGILADYYGWERTVRLALFLKFFVTFSFLAALIAAAKGNPYFVWFFFTAEAIVDSFASSFLSGSYQAAYYDWYARNLKKNNLSPGESPPLFLASFRYAYSIRFLLPLFVTVSVLVFQALARNVGVVGSYAVAFASIGAILILRLIVLLRVSSDLKGSESRTLKLKTFDGFFGPLSKWKLGLRSPYFAIYVSAITVNIFAVFYLIGQLFKLFNSTGLASNLVWSCGIIFGLFIYLIRVICGVAVFPRLGLIKKKNGIIGTVFILGCFLLLSGAVLALKCTFWLEFSLLLASSVVSAVFSDAVQYYIDSNLDEVIDASFRATWLSAANALGMLIFGIISLVVLTFNLNQVATSLFCFFIFLMCLFSILRFRSFSNGVRSLQSFSEAIGRLFGGSLALVLIIFACLDIFSFCSTSINLQRRDEEKFTKMVLESVREPVTQGSFIEASKRLRKFNEDAFFLCAKLKIWDFATGTCNKTDENFKLAARYDQEISLSSQPNQSVGVLTIFFDRSPMINAIISRVLATVLLLILCAVGIYISFRRLGLKIQNELVAILRMVGGSSGTESRDDYSEAQFSVKEFHDLGYELKKAMKLKTEYTHQIAFGKIAAQVSHDIRSPLSALDMLLSQMRGLPEQERILLRTSVNRIKDIANTLLVKNREWHQHTVPLSATNDSMASLEPVSIQLLSSLIEQIVAEKRLQYRSRSGVAIEFVLDSENFGLFSTVQPNEFKRILSNLINNGVEAFRRDGIATVRLMVEDEKLNVIVSDNGVGIPPEILSDIGRRGVTYGKPGGNGLGIWHAREAVSRWGGVLEITSAISVGTTITIQLKSESHPSWFSGNLTVMPNSTIVILDDDQSIHEVWKQRFDFLVRTQNMSLVHCRGSDDFRRWIQNTDTNGDLFLIDHELIGSKETGFDLIREYKLEQKSILITSRSDELWLQSDCSLNRIRLLPKALAGFVPIDIDHGFNMLGTCPSKTFEQQKKDFGVVQSSSSLPPPSEDLNKSEAVLIDDDTLVHLAWQIAARQSKKQLRVFKNPDEFLLNADQIELSTPIFIDSNLGGGHKGEDFAKQIYSAGFMSIFLSTGADPKSFSGMPWIKKIIGKDPPWSSVG